MRKTLIVVLAVGLLASCSGGPAEPASTTSTTSLAAPTTTTIAPVTVTTSSAVPVSGCETTFGDTAWIEVGEEPACFFVGLHHQLVIRNVGGAGIEVSWGGDSRTVAPGSAFVTQGRIGDLLLPGTHRLRSSDVAVNLVVVAPESSIFVTEPMFLRRWGPVNLGDAVEEAEAALGAALFFPDEELVPDGACLYGYVEGDPYSPGFMVLDRSRVVRMDATDPEHRTASGIRIGSSAADVFEAYGELIERSPHAYVDGEYLTLVPRDAADRDHRLVFETIRDEFAFVNGFHTGLAGPASWVEGCS